MNQEKYSKTITDLCQSPIIGPAISLFLKSNKQSSFTRRGMAMFMVSDEGIPLFDEDRGFKNENWESNHAFADLLGGNKLNNPIIFWISRNNPNGCSYIFEKQPIPHHVLKIGQSYLIEDILISLCRALKYENEKIIAPYFFRLIKKSINKDIRSIAPICKDVFYEIEPEIEQILKSKIVLKHGVINWIVGLNEIKRPDLQTICKILKLEESIIGDTDARDIIRYRKLKDPLDQQIELDFPKFIALEMKPPIPWVLIDIYDTYFGKNWIPLLNHVLNSNFNTGGLVIFIKKELISDNLYADFIQNKKCNVITV